MKTVRVNASSPYDVLIGRSLLDSLGAHIKCTVGECKICIVTDDKVDALYSLRAQQALQREGYSYKKFVIKNGEEVADIKGVAEGIYGSTSVRILFNKNDKKSIFVNDLQVLKIGEILGNINSVFFNPGELKLVQESPEDRRRFMNISLSQMSKKYSSG